MKKRTKSTKIGNIKKTYRRTRKAIGWLGMLLPFILILFSLIPFFETDVQPSISDYYYTNLREIFTGTLCATSLFLIAYKGYYNKKLLLNDNVMTNAAGILALGVAFMPTNPFTCDDKIYSFLPICAPWTGWIHYILAGFFFSILGNISHNIFVIGQEETKDIPVSRWNENNIYKICGKVIFISIILIPLCMWLKLVSYSTLVLEAIALVAFGISWLIKGRVFGQSGAVGRVLYREHH